MLFKKQNYLFVFVTFFVWFLLVNYYGQVSSEISSEMASSTLIVSLSGEGTGKVVATNVEGISCDDRFEDNRGCFFSLPFGMDLNFKAYPDFISTFEDWKAPKPCLGQTECSLRLDSSHVSVWAKFGEYPVKEGDEDCAEVRGRCIDLDIPLPYGPCEVNEQKGRVAWDLCRFDPAFCEDSQAYIDLCRAEESSLYRCCVPIEEEKDEGCLIQGGECIWLGTADPKEEGAACMVGGEEGNLALGLCQSDANNYYSCCLVKLELSFSGEPQNIKKGDSSTLRWESKGATSCLATGAWEGEKNLSGNERVSPEQTSTYTLTCSVGNRQIVESVTISVEEEKEEEEEEEKPPPEEEEEEGCPEETDQESVGIPCGSLEPPMNTIDSIVNKDGKIVYCCQKIEEEEEEEKEEEEKEEEEEEEKEEPKEEDPVTRDMGCEELGGECMLKGECTTGCTKAALCRSTEQDYSEEKIYECCLDPVHCQGREEVVSRETAFGNVQTNKDCPFALRPADSYGELGQDTCSLWCIEGPYADQDLKYLERYKEGSEEEVKEVGSIKTKYKDTKETNSVVISHCYSRHFLAPGSGKIVGSYITNYETEDGKYLSGIFEFQTGEFLYRVEPVFVLGALRATEIDGQPSIKFHTVNKHMVLAKLAFGDDHQSTHDILYADMDKCDKYGMYVEVFTYDAQELDNCADCHFVDEYGCNFFSTGGKYQDYAEAHDKKVDCGRCERGNNKLPKCFTEEKETGMICEPKGELEFDCEDEDCEESCIEEENPDNYCCDLKKRKGDVGVCCDKGCESCEKSCIPIEDTCDPSEFQECDNLLGPFCSDLLGMKRDLKKLLTENEDELSNDLKKEIENFIERAKEALDQEDEDECNDLLPEGAQLEGKAEEFLNQGGDPEGEPNEDGCVLENPELIKKFGDPLVPKYSTFQNDHTICSKDGKGVIKRRDTKNDVVICKYYRSTGSFMWGGSIWGQAAQCKEGCSTVVSSSGKLIGGCNCKQTSERPAGSHGEVDGDFCCWRGIWWRPNLPGHNCGDLK